MARIDVAMAVFWCVRRWRVRSWWFGFNAQRGDVEMDAAAPQHIRHSRALRGGRQSDCALEHRLARQRLNCVTQLIDAQGDALGAHVCGCFRRRVLEQSGTVAETVANCVTAAVAHRPS